jgi:TolB-like protein/Flp pilus assembly protein TadD
MGARRLAAAAVVIGALALAVLAWYLVVRDGRKPEVTVAPARPSIPVMPSIAVLPFADMSPQKDQEYFADGIAEEILNSLAQTESLHVAGRTSSFSFKGKGDDARTIGQKLNVANLLEGSVRKEGTHVRITAQLVNAADGFHLWSQSYDRELTGVFAAQDEIARAVVEALKLRLVPARRRHEPAPEAHNEYLLGNQFFYRQNYQDYVRAKAAYERAVKLDPDYAEAWAALAIASYWVADGAESVAAISKGFDEAMSYAEKSLALDPDLADGYAARGLLRRTIRTDWEGSRADLTRALKLSPSAAEVHRSYARLLATLGRLPEAIEEARKATEIDPLSALSWSTLGWLYASSGQFETARTALEKSLHILPDQNNAAANLAVLYLLEKKPAEALEAAERSTSEVFKLSRQAAALHDLGRTAEAQRLLDELIARHGHDGAFQIAEAYAWFGQADKAFEWLDRAYVQRDGGLTSLKFSTMLRGLRGGHRYAAVFAKMNLPPD